MIKKYRYNFDFFKWIKKTELVELSEINPADDPIRPELDNTFRITKGRKIFGLKYKNEIEGVVCLAFMNELPTTVKELDLMSVNEKDSQIAVAYTLWSLKKGAGKKIMKESQTYQEMVTKVESIVSSLDSEKIDLDLMLNKVEEGYKLLDKMTV